MRFAFLIAFCFILTIAFAGDQPSTRVKTYPLKWADADELLDVAHSRDTVLVANLLQRYNPLADAVKNLIDAQTLGALRHGYFENYASDESLGSQHWFWDRERSGGIFVEHGVHFFDLFAAWLGQGEVLSAQSSLRRNTDMEDQVQCSVQYRDGVLVNFYHGFHQFGQMDRQELRLVFELGDVTLYGWIPTVMRLQAVVSDASRQQLAEQFPEAQLEVRQRFASVEKAGQGGTRLRWTRR